MMMRQRTARSEYLIARTRLNLFECIDRIGNAGVSKAEVEVNTSAGVIGLCYATGNNEVLNSARMTFLKFRYS